MSARETAIAAAKATYDAVVEAAAAQRREAWRQWRAIEISTDAAIAEAKATYLAARDAANRDHPKEADHADR